MIEKCKASRKRDRRAMIAPHAVDRNCDHGVGTRKEKNIRQWPTAKNDKSPTLQKLQLRALCEKPVSGFRFGLQHLATTVKTVRADAVTHVRLTRGGLDCNARNDQSIVRTVHTALGR